MIYAIVKLLKANKTTLSCGLTERQIRMKHLIYDNFDMLEHDDEDLKTTIAEREEIESEEVTEDMLYSEKNDLYSDYFDDELDNLDIKLEGRIIAIASLGLWNGKKSGYKIGSNNLNEIMTMGNEDYIEVWSDGYNIHKKSAHHDGTNRLLFRMIREDRNIDNFTNKIYNNEPISKNVLNYYTKSIEKDVRQIFGW